MTKEEVMIPLHKNEDSTQFHKAGNRDSGSGDQKRSWHSGNQFINKLPNDSYFNRTFDLPSTKLDVTVKYSENTKIKGLLTFLLVASLFMVSLFKQSLFVFEKRVHRSCFSVCFLQI